MESHPPTDAELRAQYGPDVEIRRTVPMAAEIQEKNSWLEKVAGTVGYQKWMWRSMTGRLLAIVIIPATISGVRPDGAYHLWREVPPGKLSIDPVADERLGWATGRVEAS